MTTVFSRTRLAGVIGVLSVAVLALPQAAGPFPEPARDTPRAAARDLQTAVLAGGCFWGVEAVFEGLEGVADVSSGYAGGPEKAAHYETVSTGRTGHAEAVKVTYDASKITYGQLLKVFFSVAHDPTELNRQGPDVGTQYRSAIFTANDEQKEVAAAYIAQLDAAKTFNKQIATTVGPLQGFFLAEAEHQNFLKRNPTNSYIVHHDLPKLAALKAQWPELLKKKGDEVAVGRRVAQPTRQHRRIAGARFDLRRHSCDHFLGGRLAVLDRAGQLAPGLRIDPVAVLPELLQARLILGGQHLAGERRELRSRHPPSGRSPCRPACRSRRAPGTGATACAPARRARTGRAGRPGS